MSGKGILPLLGIILHALASSFYCFPQTIFKTMNTRFPLRCLRLNEISMKVAKNLKYPSIHCLFWYFSLHKYQNFSILNKNHIRDFVHYEKYDLLPNNSNNFSRSITNAIKCNWSYRNGC